MYQPQTFKVQMPNYVNDPISDPYFLTKVGN